MGCLFRFSCPACGYSAEVSGGDDCGMAAATTTVYCEDCKELSDILIGYVLETAEGQMFKNEPPTKFRCERSRKHRIRKWTSGEPCPRCGGKMENNGGTVLWD